MTVQVQKIQQEQGMLEGMAKGALPAVGQAVGSAYGGPAGGMAGSALGGAVAGGIGNAGVDPVAASSGGAASNAVMRRMQTIESDPTNVLKAGRAALNDVDDNTKARLEPVFDEAIKRSVLEKQKQGIIA